MSSIIVEKDLFDFAEKNRQEKRAIQAIKRELAQEKLDILRPLEGKMISIMLRSEAPRADYRIKGIRGVLLPFGDHADIHSIYNTTLNFVSVQYITDLPYNGKDHYELKVDDIDSIQMASVELNPKR